MRSQNLVPLLVCALAAPLAAQRATVYYDHRPGGASSEGRLSYLPSGEPKEARRLGQPPRLDIPKGAQVCLVIENANPLLYSYSLGAKAIVVETPAEVTKLVDLLSGLVNSTGAATNTTEMVALGARFTSLWQGGEKPLKPVVEASAIPSYYSAIALMLARYRDMQEAKLASDAGSLESAHARIVSLFNEAMAFAKQAQAVYDGKLTAADQKNDGVVLASQQLQSLLQSVRALQKEVQSAWEKRDDPVCSDAFDGQALSLSLSIQSRITVGDDFTPRRPIGDKVATVEASPIDGSRFSVSPGGLLSALIGGQQRFGVTDGVVTRTADQSVRFLPTVFLSGRATPTSWLWGTIGTSVDDKGVEGFFFGLTGRFGVPVIGPNMSLGVGLSLTRVVTGLKDGAVGHPLPTGIDNIEAITQTDLRPGLGIVFSLTGLSPKH